MQHPIDDRDEWTVGSLKEHVLSIMDERDARYDQRFTEQERALTKAETTEHNKRTAAISLWAIIISVSSLLVTLLLFLARR